MLDKNVVKVNDEGLDIEDLGLRYNAEKDNFYVEFRCKHDNCTECPIVVEFDDIDSATDLLVDNELACMRR